MRLSEIKKIKRKYKDVFEALEEYDKTRKLLIGRERIDVTLSKRTIDKLKKLKKKTGKPISRIIESAVEKCGC